MVPVAIARSILSFALSDRSLDRLVRLMLVGAQVRVRLQRCKRAQLGRVVTVEQLAEGQTVWKPETFRERSSESRMSWTR